MLSALLKRTTGQCDGFLYIKHVLQELEFFSINFDVSEFNRLALFNKRVIFSMDACPKCL